MESVFRRSSSDKPPKIAIERVFTRSMRWHWGRAEGGRLDLDPTNNVVSRARAKTFGVLPAAASPPRPRSAKKASSSGGSANMLEGFPSNPCVVRRFALRTPNLGPKGLKSNAGMRTGGCSARGVWAATNGYTHGRRVGMLVCSSSPPSPSIARSANGAQCKESSAQPRACPARGGPVRGPARVSDRSGSGSRCLALCVGREGAAPATLICQCPRSSGRPAAPFARRRCTPLRSHSTRDDDASHPWIPHPKPFPQDASAGDGCDDRVSPLRHHRTPPAAALHVPLGLEPGRHITRGSFRRRRRQRRRPALCAVQRLKPAAASSLRAARIVVGEGKEASWSPRRTSGKRLGAEGGWAWDHPTRRLAAGT